MDATIERVARYVHGLQFAHLPEQAVHEARRRIIDSIACAAAASSEDFCKKLVNFSTHFSGTPAARIWGTGQSTAVDMAAFVNGTMLRYLDFSDTVLSRSNGHPSDMIGGLIAVAEAFDKSGVALLASVVAAYEVYCSLCAAVPMAASGIDQATAAAIGAAAGAAHLFNLPEDEIANALALALTANLHLYNVRCGNLSDWKGCAGPNGARNGVFAALLAREGITGPTGAVEGKSGFQSVVGSFDWQPGAHAMPLISSTHLKFHPVCYHGQSAIDAALALRDKVVAHDVVAIDIETYEASYLVMGHDPQRWAPENRETADHSLPFTVATAWITGGLPPDAYEPQRLSCATTRQLMSRISVRAHEDLTREFPAMAQTRITVRDRHGDEFTHFQMNPKGNAGNPLSDAELETKFINLFQLWGNETVARGVLEMLWSIDRLPQVRALVDALCFEHKS